MTPVHARLLGLGLLCCLSSLFLLAYKISPVSYFLLQGPSASPPLSQPPTLSPSSHSPEQNSELRCNSSCPFDSETAFNRSADNVIDSHGGWKYDKAVIQGYHVSFDPGFARSLVGFVTTNTPGKGSGESDSVTMGDIGAGVGQLGAWLRDNQVTNVSWFGWDGGANIQEFFGEEVALNGQDSLVVPKICWMDAGSDISMWLSQMCGAPYDWVVSVEVGEHVPAEQMEIFVNNLVTLARHGVIITWAVPGQGGRSHVNEMDNAAVIQVMEHRELEYDEEATVSLRNTVEIRWYLRNTIMVFRKKA